MAVMALGYWTGWQKLNSIIQFVAHDESGSP